MAEIRTKVLHKFCQFLNEKESRKLENALYNFVIAKARGENVERSWNCATFKKYYSSRARSLLFNLQHGVLKEKLQSKTFSMKNVPYMTPWEIWPEKYESYFQKKLEKEMIQLQNQTEAENMTGMFVCKKCKSDCTVYFSLQTRSADEPMTNYITCKKCGHKWKD